MHFMAEQLLRPVFRQQLTKVVKRLEFSDTTGTQWMASGYFFFFFLQSPVETSCPLVDRHT